MTRDDASNPDDLCETTGEARFGWARRNIMLTIAYDGTNYRGWQVQPNGLSVQECVETAVERLTGARQRVYCAGRTDAGVHALGQVANFPTNSSVPISNIRRGLQSFLPEDIVIVSAREVSRSFHATYSAVCKRYRYVIHDGDVCPPFLKPYVHRSQHPLDIDLMRAAAEFLLGTHDFRCFEKHFPNKSTSVRTIMDVSVQRFSCWLPWTSLHSWSPIHGARHDQPELPLIVFEVMADGFLYNMVRAIVGTLMEIGRGKQSPEFLGQVIRSLDRSQAGMTAMPNGLYLVSVDYPEELCGNL
jgi:tRNA pseudouridine38-40 synthase